MVDDEPIPHDDPPHKTPQCADCGVPLKPADASFCAAHRQREGERTGPGHHLTEVLLLGFFLLSAMLAMLLFFT